MHDWLEHIHFTKDEAVTFCDMGSKSHLGYLTFWDKITLVREVFFRHEEHIQRHTKKRREKTSGCLRCESHYHATIGVNQHHEID